MQLQGSRNKPPLPKPTKPIVRVPQLPYQVGPHGPQAEVILPCSPHPHPLATGVQKLALKVVIPTCHWAEPFSAAFLLWICLTPSQSRPVSTTTSCDSHFHKFTPSPGPVVHLEAQGQARNGSRPMPFSLPLGRCTRRQKPVDFPPRGQVEVLAVCLLKVKSWRLACICPEQK